MGQTGNLADCQAPDEKPQNTACQQINGQIKRVINEPFKLQRPSERWLVGWFCCFTSQVNSYGHCGTVSSPNHIFFPGQA